MKASGSSLKKLKELHTASRMFRGIRGQQHQICAQVSWMGGFGTFSTKLILLFLQVTSEWGGRSAVPPRRVKYKLYQRLQSWSKESFPLLLLTCLEQHGLVIFNTSGSRSIWSISVPGPKHTQTNTRHTCSSIMIMKLNQSKNQTVIIDHWCPPCSSSVGSFHQSIIEALQ